MFYVKYSLVECGGFAIIPIEAVDTIAEEIRNMHYDKNTDLTIAVNLVEMTEKDFAALPEFKGW